MRVIKDEQERDIDREERQTKIGYGPVVIFVASNWLQLDRERQTDTEKQRQTLSTGLSLNFWPAVAADGQTQRWR